MSRVPHTTLPRRVLVVSMLLVGLAMAGVAAARSPATNIHVGKTFFGGFVAPRLQNGHGYPIYIFTGDQHNRSHCTRDCLSTFTPVIARGRVKAWNGVRQKLLGLINRGHGVWQVSYNHHPLYTSSDDVPSQALSDGMCAYRGHWYIMGKSGNPDERYSVACGY